MLNQTIIIPMPQERDCILVEGKRFCESKDLSNAEVGFMIVALVLAAAYLIFLIYLHVDRDCNGVAVFGLGVGLPLLVFGACLMLMS